MTAPAEPAGIERVDPAQRLSIAVLGDFDGAHTRSWVRWFIGRGHDVHAISFYRPGVTIEGATTHALRERREAGGSAGGGGGASRLPRGLARVAHALRYRAAGVARVVREIDPDVFHGHFVVEHGFYGATAGFHPYVVSAWGSDVLVEPERDPVSRRIAAWTLRRADLVTSNNVYMAGRIAALGVEASRVEVVTLGADRYDLERSGDSVNVSEGEGGGLCIISTRAHEPLYNIGEIVDAYGEVARARPGTRLVVAHGGSRTEALQARARAGGGRVEFVGYLGRAAFREALSQAHIFVSVPSSDATSVALLQAMAAGCFPIVSDLPSQRELIEDGVNGFRVPLHRPQALAERIQQAAGDHELRRRAAAMNRAIVEERGLNEVQMAKMERLYLRLAGRQA